MKAEGHAGQSEAPHQPRAHVRALARDLGFLGAGMMLFAVQQLLFRTLALATLPASDYGRLSLVLSVYGVVILVGAMGMPDVIVRTLAPLRPENVDDEIAAINAAIRASAGPTMLAAALAAGVALAVLQEPLSAVLVALGVTCWVYSLVAAGVFRGRGQVRRAASVQPLAGAMQCLGAIGLAAFEALSTSTAIAVFVLGHFTALGVSARWLVRDNQSINAYIGRPPSTPDHAPIPADLLRASAWLGAGMFLTAMLPVVIRAAAALDSYATVAAVDVALTLVAMFQRLGGIVLQALLPHHARATKFNASSPAVSLRVALLTSAPFLLLGLVASSTSAPSDLLSLVGASELTEVGPYLGLALLAAPSRLLYGVAQSRLIARDEPHFLAMNALTTTGAGAVMILALAQSGSVLAAFACFAAMSWAQLGLCERRLRRA